MANHTEPNARAIKAETVAAEVAEAAVKTHGPRVGRRVAADYDEVMNRQEAARYLHVQPGTLLQWAAAGIGPRSGKMGSGRTARRFYRRSWLDEFLEACVDVGRGGTPVGHGPMAI